jgi:hypothetical protein
MTRVERIVASVCYGVAGASLVTVLMVAAVWAIPILDKWIGG